MTQTTNERIRIFFSYRRADARGASGRLYDWLRIAFGLEQVFRDVASIGAGKWRQKNRRGVGGLRCPSSHNRLRWCEDTNRSRFADEGDMVRHELVTSLAHLDKGGTDKGLNIIPTVIEGATVGWWRPTNGPRETPRKPASSGARRRPSRTREGWSLG